MASRDMSRVSAALLLAIVVCIIPTIVSAARSVPDPNVPSLVEFEDDGFNMTNATGRKLLAACNVYSVQLSYSSGGENIHRVHIKNLCGSRLNMCLLSGCQSWYDETNGSDAFFEQTQTYPGLCRLKVPIPAGQTFTFQYTNYYGWTFCRQHLRWDNGNEIVNNGPTPC